MKTRKGVRASYREAVIWIAHNDECGEGAVSVVAYSITVLLIADLWRKDPETVARAVVAERKREGLI